MVLLQVSLLTSFKDDASLSIIESINQRWHFLETSLFINTRNDMLEDDVLEKHHLFYFLTLKKHHCFIFFL